MQPEKSHHIDLFILKRLLDTGHTEATGRVIKEITGLTADQVIKGTNTLLRKGFLTRDIVKEIDSLEFQVIITTNGKIEYGKIKDYVKQ